MSKPPQQPAAFTLVEVLLALAIVAMAATLILPGITSLLGTINRQDPHQVLREAIASARLLALDANREVTLRFDRRNKLVVWTDGDRISSLPWPAGATGQFLPAQRGAMTLVGGRLGEAGEMDPVRFFPDGTCDEFRAAVRSGAAAARIVTIDRWTGAEVLDAQTAHSP